MDDMDSACRRRGRAKLAALHAIAAAGFAVALLAPIEPASAECAFDPSQAVVARDTPYSRSLGAVAKNLSGDVHTLVFGDSVAGRWPLPLLDEALHDQVLVLAHGGDAIENTTWTVEQINPAAGMKVRLVLVVVGAKNARGDEPCVIRLKVEALLKALKARLPNATVYYVDVVQKGLEEWPMEKRVLAENEAIAGAAKAYGAHVVEVHAPVLAQCHSIKDCPLFSPDHVHPSEAGYAVMTTTLRQALAP